MTSETKQCQNCKKQFNIEPDDFSFYEKIGVPAPTWCPSCRLQRRLAYQNQRALYKRNCNLCNKNIVAMYDKHVPFPVYCMGCGESDKWDAAEHGRDYDFNRSFFKQYSDLQKVVPKKNLIGKLTTWTNSDYNNMAHELKNCYLLFNSDYNENTMYGSEVESTKDSIDVLMVDSVELCYSSVGIDNSQRIFFSMDCNNCNNIWFSRNLINCIDCFGCYGLRNKQYHIFNKPYTKEEFEKEIAQYSTGSYQEKEELLKQFEQHRFNYPYRYMRGLKNINVSGQYIFNSKNVRDSFFVTGAEDCRYCMWLIIKPTKDSYDYTQFGENVERTYDSITSGLNVSDCKFCFYCVDNVSRLTYSSHCHNGCSDLFGCDGLKSKKYCILNKQYSKEEYNNLIPRIIDHMNAMPYVDAKGREYRYGEFYPLELSLFGYNETDAQEFFPLTKDDIMLAGYNWKDIGEKEHEPTLSWRDLKDNIFEVDDALLKEIILCEDWEADEQKAVNHNCTKVFRITAREFEFYRRFNLPLPRKCPNSRHYYRFTERNPVKLWHRKCQCAGITSSNGNYYNVSKSHQSHGPDDPCTIEFETSYAPDRKEIVYCEACYQGEIV